MNNLKKFLASALFVGMTLPFASAQFYMGARAGINLASMNTNIAGSESSSIIGISGGLTTQFQLTKKSYFGMDALFSQFGNKATTVTKAPGTDVTLDQTTKISYVLLPLYFNYEIPFQPKRLVPYRMKESSVSAHLYGGGYFGYALGATLGSTTTTIKSDGTPTTVTTIEPAAMVKTNYNAVDFGLMVGAGFSFRLDEAKKQRMSIDFRYFLGMSDFDKNAATSAKNTPLSVSVAYSRKMTKRIYTNRKRF